MYAQVRIVGNLGRGNVVRFCRVYGGVSLYNLLRVDLVVALYSLQRVDLGSKINGVN